MRERHKLFFGLRLVSKEFQHPAIQTKTELHFGGFFHQIKVCQPKGRQDSMQTVIQTSRRLDSFLHEAAQNFDVFPRVKLKNQKPIALTSFSRPIQWYHSHVDLIWPDDTFK
jgi:hypothetical protein